MARLVEFASVVDAVSCAIEVQEGLARHDIIKLRVGVHLGDITHEEEDIFGDGLNIAARLQEIAEPGGIVISDMARRSIDSKLAADFVDLGVQDLKNIVEPITVYGWGMTAITADATASPISNKPSIAVLPFDNMSGDPEQDYFADGLCEDLIMALSQYSGLLVIARNSTFIYKEQAIDIATVARDLNVEYVLEGSVRRAGQRIRITAQLIDTVSGTHVWAERYDRDLNDIFAVQDEITLNIVGALGQKLSEGEYAAVSRKGTDSLEAWRSVVLAMKTYRDVSEAGVEQTLEHLREAVRIDPGYAFALGMMAFMYIHRVRYGWSRGEASLSNKIAPDLSLAYCA